MTSPLSAPSTCLKTGNPCGSDTWGPLPCKCDHCQQWLWRALHEAVTEINRLRAERDHRQVFSRPIEDLSDTIGFNDGMDE